MHATWREPGMLQHDDRAASRPAALQWTLVTPGLAFCARDHTGACHRGDGRHAAADSLPAAARTRTRTRTRPLPSRRGSAAAQLLRAQQRGRGGEAFGKPCLCASSSWASCRSTWDDRISASRFCRGKGLRRRGPETRRRRPSGNSAESRACERQHTRVRFQRTRRSRSALRRHARRESPLISDQPPRGRSPT